MGGGRVGFGSGLGGYKQKTDDKHYVNS